MGSASITATINSPLVLIGTRRWAHPATFSFEQGSIFIAGAIDLLWGICDDVKQPQALAISDMAECDEGLAGKSGLSICLFIMLAVCQHTFFCWNQMVQYYKSIYIYTLSIYLSIYLSMAVCRSVQLSHVYIYFTNIWTKRWNKALVTSACSINSQS